MAITVVVCYNGWVDTAQCTVMQDTLQKINNWPWSKEVQNSFNRQANSRNFPIDSRNISTYDK